MKENKNPFYYESRWIHKLETREHWNSYWIQQKLIEDFVKKDENILEIGVGSAFCSNYLKSRGFSITTLDIDKDKKPDIIANICTDKVDYTCDVILAFEVFEHIPFACFSKVLSKISKQNVKKIILSIPESKFYFLKFNLKILNKELSFQIPVTRNKLPQFLKRRYKLCKTHNWELNYSHKYTRRKLENLFLENGFYILKTIKSKQNNHVFFVLQNKRLN